MKTILCVVLSVCICMTSGFRLVEKRSTSETFSGTIGYTSGSSTAGRSKSAEPSTSQTVTIKDQELRLTIANNMDAVLDYNQILLFARRSSENVCIVTKFNELAVPPIEVIKEMLLEYAEGRTFQMPTGHLEMDLQKSVNQQTPFMYELSKELCAGLEIINYEPKPEKVQILSDKTALAVQHQLRPKREVGWGEVLVIVIVILILL